MTLQTKQEKPSCLSRHVLTVFRKNSTAQKDLEEKLGLIDYGFHHNKAAIKDEIRVLDTKLRKITTVKEKMEISVMRRRFLAEHGYYIKERQLDLKEFIKSVDDIIYTRKGTPIPLAFKQPKGVNGLRKINPGPFARPTELEESNSKKEVKDERKLFQSREIVPPLNGRKIEEVYNDLKAEGRRLIKIRDLKDYVCDDLEDITDLKRNEEDSEESPSEDESNDEIGNLEKEVNDIRLEPQDPMDYYLAQIKDDLERKTRFMEPQQIDTQILDNGFLRTNANHNKSNNNNSNNLNKNNQIEHQKRKQGSSLNSPLSRRKALSPSSRNEAAEQESGHVQPKPTRQDRGRPMSCPPPPTRRDPSATVCGIRFLERKNEEKGKDVESNAGKTREAWRDGSREDNNINIRKTKKSKHKTRRSSSFASSAKERPALTPSPPSQKKIDSLISSATSVPAVKMLRKKTRKKVTFEKSSELEKEMVYDARPHEALTKGYATLQMTVARKSVAVYVPKFKNEIFCKEQLSGRANAKSSFEIEQARIKRKRMTLALKDEDSCVRKQ